MATVALAPILQGAFGVAKGSAAFAKIATLSSFLGPVIDSAFLLPALMKGPEESKAKGIGITGLDEGDPHQFAIGPFCRIPGFLYWQPEKPRFVEGRQSGGKGGGLSKGGGTPDKYYTDGVFALTRTGIDPFDGTRYPAQTDLSIVWMDGKIRYLGGRANSSRSTQYEIYEEVVNDSGFVSLVYTIQTKANAPQGEAFSDWALQSKFRAGESLNIPNCADSLTGLPSFLSDQPPTSGSVQDVDRTLEPIGSGELPDGRQFLQIEWKYYLDRDIYRPRETGPLGATSTPPYYNPTFYQGLQERPGSIIDPGGVYFGARIPFEWFLGTAYTQGPGGSQDDWVPPLQTTPLDPVGASQDRGYLEFPATGVEGGLFIIDTQDPPVDEGLLRSIDLRNGELTESGIAVMEDYEGQGEQPALRGFSHLVIENLDLFDFGSRLPNIEVLVQADTGPVPIAEAVQRFCTVFCGIDPDLIDVSDLENSTDVVRGWHWQSEYGLAALQPLIIAYDLTMLEDSGKLTFRRRSSAPEYTIPLEDLDSASGSAGPLVEIKEKGPAEKVKSTTVKYTDPFTNYSIGEQVFTRPDLERARTQKIDLTALTLRPSEARAICARATWQAAMYDRELTFTLGPKWGHLRAGDVLIINGLLGADYRLIAADVTRGADGRMEIQALPDTGVTSELPDLPVDAGGTGVNSSSFYLPPSLAIQALDIGPLIAEHYDYPGLYLCTAAKFYGADYRGATAYAAKGVGRTLLGIGGNVYVRPDYEELPIQTLGEATVGALLTEVPDGEPDVINRLDEGFTLRLYHGELESISTLELYRRKNLMWIDGEVVAFEKAELIDDPVYGYPNTYKISGEFLRGLYNTESKIGTHPPGSGVVLLKHTDFRRVSIEPEDVDGRQFRFQAVPSGGEVGAYDDEAAYAVVCENGNDINTGKNFQPFPVAHVRGIVEASAVNSPAWDLNTQWLVGDEIFTWGADSTRYSWQCLQDHIPRNVDPGVEPNYGYPTATNSLWLALDSPRDYRIRWNYRSPVPVASLPLNTVETKRSTIFFRVRIFTDDPTPVLKRTVTDIDESNFLYRHEDQMEDGIFPGDTFIVEVRADNLHMTSDVVTATLPDYE